jgi:hypothetical protein
MNDSGFPPFDLGRLIESALDPSPGERLCILIDFADDPRRIQGFGFAGEPGCELQTLAYEVFYRGLVDGVMDRFGLGGVGIYAYRATGGSNLDLPAEVWAPEGRRLGLEPDVCARYDIVLCMGRHSATAPLLALARRYGFRGASMHNIDRDILATGLAVDYRDVVRQTQRIREGLTRADSAEIEFEAAGERMLLTLDLGGQEAGTSCGKCSERRPNIEHLPDGEVYLVPRSAHGVFPLTCDGGTVGAMTVEDGRVVGGRLLLGERAPLDRWLARFLDDPATGTLCELGFGTQRFPYTGRGIQDEKILGTIPLATGRSDHLGGAHGPGEFRDPANATHDDHLFNPRSSPDVDVRQVRLYREGAMHVLIESYQPAPYLRELADGAPGSPG